MKCRDYKGELLDAPPDLPIVVLSMFDGMIVWSRVKGGKRHRVRYGLQYEDVSGDDYAAEQLGRFIRHNVECEGLLDD